MMILCTRRGAIVQMMAVLGSTSVVTAEDMPDVVVIVVLIV